MARHELLDPPEAGIAARPPGDSVLYASFDVVGNQVLGWIRATVVKGLLTLEQVP